MAYNLPQGFNIGNTDPIDARFTVSSSVDLYAFSVNNVFEGLTAYVTSSKEYFILTDIANWNNVNGWTKIDIALSGSGLGLQETLESGDSASIGFSASIANIEEVSFIGSSVIPIKLKKHATQDYLVVSGSGLVIQETFTTPSAVAGAVIYSGSNFFAAIQP